MEEIYIDTISTITLHVYIDNSLGAPNGGSPTVTITNLDTGEQVVSNGTTQSNSVGVYEYQLDSSITDICGTYKATWTYTHNGNTVNTNSYFTVVVPYVSYTEIINEFSSLSSKTFEEFRSMERTVRKVIESHTDQMFGPKGSKTIRVFGSGSNYLHLPDRIYELEYVAAEDPDITLYDQTASGGLLYKRDHDGVLVEPAEVLPNTKPIELVSWDKEQPWTIRRKYGRHPGPDPKRDITAGWLSDKNIFESKRSYVIRARVGWEYVPNEVNQAAKLLVNDYFCNDSVYHMRNVEDVSSADWSMGYGGDHFSSTGNVYVDQMLSEFINVNWVVL